jgi:Tfp pilus assembly protein PilO
MRFEKQQLGILIAIIVLITIFGVVQYGPLRSQAHAMEHVKAVQLSANTKTETQIKSLPALRTQLTQMQAKVGNYDVKIPDDRMLGTFLQEIADVMNRHNLGEQIVQPDSETQVGSIVCIPVRVQFKGTMRQIFGFFRSLQTVERLIRIQQVQMKNENDMSGLVTVAAIGTIYYTTSRPQGRGR